MPKKLSIIIPLFNEEETIVTIIKKVLAAPLPDSIVKEILVVNDCSTDHSMHLVEQFRANEKTDNIHLFYQDKNRGKGSCIQKGIHEASGDFIIIQDADLEYDPAEYSRLLVPILEQHADVVYGSRFLGSEPHRILFFWHSIGNKFLTSLSNMFTNLNLTDMETCYKLFKSEVVKPLRLKEKKFGFEPEVTAKISKLKGVRLYEVGISYYGRSYADGKKIGWKDGFHAIFCILRYNLFR